MVLYFTYVLKSKKDGRLYTGWTNNLDARLKKHNSGKVEATKYRQPLDLVYFEACQSKIKAISRERSISRLVSEEIF